MRRRGIDVSVHNGVVDWERVKESGVEFAMLRAGFGWDNDSQIDKQLDNNIAGCCSCDLPFGFYHYSYAMSPDDARREAAWFLRVIRGVRPEYPVAFDFEEIDQVSGWDKYGGWHEGLPLDQQVAIIRAWMDVVEAAGYYAVLYMSQSPITRLHKHAPDVIGKYDAWVARWSADNAGYPGPCGIWQYDVIGKTGRKGQDYTVYGAVPGVGANCDLNYAYKDYPAVIKAAGLNGWTAQDTPDGPQETLHYRDLYESEQAMRIAAEADRDVWRDKFRELEAEHNATLRDINELHQKHWIV